MCGIAGGYFKEFRQEDADAILLLAKRTGVRGSDGFGIAVTAPGTDGQLRVGVLRVASPDEAFWGTTLPELLASFEGPGVNIVMCSRAQPLPEAETVAERLQPYEFGNFLLVHNGTISNDRELWAEHFPGEEHPGIDTIVVARLVAKLDSVDEVCRQIVGGFAFGVIDKKASGEIDPDIGLSVWRNVKTCWVSRGEGWWAFASEPEMLEDAFNAATLGTPTLERLPPYTSYACATPLGDQYTLAPVVSRHWASTPDLDDNKAVVVTSGGIDSITAAFVAAKAHQKDVTLVTFPHGQLSERAELNAVLRIAEEAGFAVKEIPLHWLGEFGKSPLTDPTIELPMGMKSAESTLCWTPGRNMVMVTAAAAFAESIGAKWLYYGNNMEEEATAYGDNDLDFVWAMNQALQMGTLKGVQIRRALARLMKPEILVVGTYLGVPFDKTWSCDRGLQASPMDVGADGRVAPTLPFVPCGECGCCTTRRYAFKRAGIEDPQVYRFPLRDTYPWTEAKEYDVQKLLLRLW